MMQQSSPIPDDLAACQQLIAEMQRQLSLLETTASQQAGTIESPQQRIEKLLHELDLFKRHLFGQRRERFVDDPGQQKLFGSDAVGEPVAGPAIEQVPEDSTASSRRRGHGRRPLAEFLPRRDVIHDLSEAERVCPCCGTLCDWMAACADLVQLFYVLMVDRTLQSKVLGTDDTPVPVRDPELDRTRNGHFWAYVGDDEHPYVCYDFTASRSRDGPAKFLQNFRGYLQGDAYSGYIEIARQSNGRITHVGCWAHARRYFVRAEEKAPNRVVHEALSYIQCLYDVEDEAAKLPAADRQTLRQQKSVPLLETFHRWLATQQASALPASPLGEAVSYALHQWESLCLYTRDGDLPIDNNRTERALRQQVLGRSNWMFVGSEKGGRTAAVLYSLVASAKRLRIDPFAYLRDVFTRIPSATPDQFEELLPNRWIQQHPESRLAHREQEATKSEARRRARRARHRELATQTPAANP